MADYVAETVIDWRSQRPDLDTSPLEVVTRILRAAHLLQARLDALAASHGLSRKGDLDVLSTLRRTGPPYVSTPTTLARRLQVTSGGMTSRLDRLEGLGLIERRPDPADRRGVRVRLTRAGAELVDQAFVESLGAQRMIIEELSPSRRADLAELLEELLIALDDTPG